MRTDLTHRLPLLVTGIAGVAGYNAFLALRARYPGRVLGLRPRQTWRLTGDGVIALEGEDKGGLADLFRSFEIRSVLNCTGNCALKSCELDPAMARQLNVDSAENVAVNVRRHGCRLVHLSSDLVFSGTLGRPYTEDDATDPVTVYGKTMVEGEAVIAGEVPGAATLRISLPMGPSFNGHAGAIDWIQSRFRAGRPATLYFDEVRSCTYADDLTRVFVHLLAGDEPGLYHCGGPRPLSLYQIGQIVNRVGGYDPSLLKGCPRREAGPVPPRAGDVRMDSDRLYRLLGEVPFVPWPAGDLWPADRRWHFAEDGGPRGSRQALAARLYRYALQPAGA
jgi:dTDP-4-dehydrorhamnose reductase